MKHLRQTVSWFMQTITLMMVGDANFPHACCTETRVQSLLEKQPVSDVVQIWAKHLWRLTQPSCPERC